MESILRDNFGIFVSMILGIAALLIIHYDRRFRLKIHKEDRAERTELQREEIQLRREHFESESKERQQRLEWLRRESMRLQEVGDELATKISEHLAEDHQWATEALEKAKLGPHAATLFGERTTHFEVEKKFMADHFTPILLRRVKRFAEAENHVFILLDSGTTIFPFFERLGNNFIRARANGEEWVDGVALITNNLPGIAKLMEVGRLDPNNRYSPLAVACELLPGVPLPIYSAVTGKKAEEALHRIREDAPEKSVFIALTAGNWVRLRPEPPACPVPLARGVGHLDFKRCIIRCADEVFVVTPLGKVFGNAHSDLQEINQALDFSSSNIDPDRQEYHEVQFDSEKASVTKIVTTSRPNGFLLSNLSLLVREHLGAREWARDLAGFASASHVQLPHVVFPFDKMPKSLAYQIEVEFPHPHTRHEEFMKNHFFCPL